MYRVHVYNIIVVECLKVKLHEMILALLQVTIEAELLVELEETQKRIVLRRKQT